MRRAFVIATILGAVSAAGALAVAPEIARFGRSLGIYAALKGRGFTPVPAADAALRTAAGLLNQRGDSAVGKYCRFPSDADRASLSHVAADVPPNAGGAAPLSLDGQSRGPSLVSEAVCTGDSTSASPAPDLITR